MRRKTQAKYFQDAMLDVLSDISDTLIKKQLDYGPNAIKRFGLEGIVIRMSDKMERLINLIELKKDPAIDESIEDTLFDLAGYAVIGLMYLEGNFPLPIKQKDEV